MEASHRDVEFFEDQSKVLALGRGLSEWILNGRDRL